MTFNCGFTCALGLEKLRETPWCNYVLIKLTNFIFLVERIFSLFCPLRGVVYQRFTSGNPGCSGPTAILRQSNTAYHSKRPYLCRRGNIKIIVIMSICESKKYNSLFEVLFHLFTNRWVFSYSKTFIIQLQCS